LKKPAPEREFIFTSRANYQEASSIIEQVKKILQENNKDGEFLYRIELILEEIILNICRYAYGAEEEGELVVRLILKQDHIVVIFEDKGRPFNPLEFKPRIISEQNSLEELEPGGLGIFLVKEMAHEVSYQYRGGKNILEITL